MSKKNKIALNSRPGCSLSLACFWPQVLLYTVYDPYSWRFPCLYVGTLFIRFWATLVSNEETGRAAAGWSVIVDLARLK